MGCLRHPGGIEALSHGIIVSYGLKRGDVFSSERHISEQSQGLKNHVAYGGFTAGWILYFKIVLGIHSCCGHELIKVCENYKGGLGRSKKGRR